MISVPHVRAWLLGILACTAWVAAKADGFSCAAALPALAAAPSLPLLRSQFQSSMGADNTISWSVAPTGRITYTPDGTIELTDDATVTLGAREIQADKATIDLPQKSVRASGKVRLTDPLVHLQGDAGYYDAQGAQFTNAQFELMKQPGRGSASSINMDPAGLLTLRHVTYTTCPLGRNDWLIRAQSLTLNTQTERGVGHGAQVDFKGVPILYLPWISFPLSDARQSGFLFPSFSTSSLNGVMISAPWYWNIAPNQDATFTSTLYSRRGLDAGAQYRYLGLDNRATIDGNFLPDDRSEGSDRSFLHINDRLELPQNWRLNVDAQNVSDAEYLEDFAEGSQATSIAFLPQDALLSHRDDIWQLEAQLLRFQTLDTILAHDDRPYMQLPRLDANGLWRFANLPGVQAAFDSELVDFWRPVGPSGWRLDARPQLSYDLTRPGYFVRPSVAWDFTQYSLSNFTGFDGSAGTPITQRNPERNLPMLTLDTGLEFERLSGALGAHDVTLEPRLMYVYIPYRDQSGLPVFDSAPPDLNLIELFQPNRYTGLDRIGDSNTLTAGLTTQVFESASGMRFLSATVGQNFFLQTPRVTLPPDETDEPPDTSVNSNLIAEIDLSAFRNWNVLLNVATDTEVARIEKTEIAVQYRADGNQVANLSYRFHEGQLEQTDASFAWPIGAHWDAYARSVYSLQDHASIENFAGFQFRGDCWGLRMIARRSVSTRTGERDTSFFVQLELNGLSNVGTGADTFLEQSIQGYSAAATGSRTSH